MLKNRYVNSNKNGLFIEWKDKRVPRTQPKKWKNPPKQDSVVSAWELLFLGGLGYAIQRVGLCFVVDRQSRDHCCLQPKVCWSPEENV